MQEFCRDHHWMTGMYKFLQAWGPQKLESMRGCPISNYQTLVSHLDGWQAGVSQMPIELVTKGKLLLLSCRDIQANLGECRFPSLLLLPPPSLIHVALLVSGMCAGDLSCRPLIAAAELPRAPGPSPFLLQLPLPHSPGEPGSCHLTLSVLTAWSSTECN